MSKRSPPIEISYLIPARNAASTLKRCIDAIKAQSGSFTYEIIVVDNGSKDTTAKIAKQCGVKYLHLKKPSRPAARNLAAKKARGKFFAFIDSDCTVPPHWISTFMKRLAESELIAACRGGFVLPGQVFPENVLKNSLYGGLIHLLGGAFLVRREAFKKVGGFDETFPYCEDIDFSWRLLAHSYQIVFADNVNTFHWQDSRHTVLFRKGLAKGFYEGKLRKKWRTLLGESLVDDLQVLQILAKNSVTMKDGAAYLGRLLSLPLGTFVAYLKPWLGDEPKATRLGKKKLKHEGAQYRFPNFLTTYRKEDEFYCFIPNQKKVLKLGQSSALFFEELMQGKTQLKEITKAIADQTSEPEDLVHRDFVSWVNYAQSEGLLVRV